jgi:hypothetical protein
MIDVRMALSVDYLPDDPAHASGFGRGDPCVLELDMMFHIEAMLCHCQFL